MVVLLNISTPSTCTRDIIHLHVSGCVNKYTIVTPPTRAYDDLWTTVRAGIYHKKARLVACHGEVPPMMDRFLNDGLLMFQLRF